jgi:hypothetical protein
MDPTQAAAEWAAKNPQAAAVLRDEGASGERDRIAAVRQQVLPGHEALIEQLAADGQTSGPEAAMRVIAADRLRQANHRQSRLDDAIDAVPQAAAPEGLEAEAQAPKPEVNGVQLADRARELIAEAQAQGRTLSATAAVAKAKQEFAQV